MLSVARSVNMCMAYHQRMTSPVPAPHTIAGKKRQLVVDELTEAALQLLAVKGFDNTTVDEIVAAAGVSRRTFFRYFASKEDVVVQLLDSLSALICEEFAARPLDEPMAVSLRHAAGMAMAECTTEDHAAKALRVAQMVLGTPSLLARYLERQTQLQDDLAALIAARRPADDLFPTIAAGTTLTTTLAIIRRWSDSNGTEDPEALLDRAFEKLAPAFS
jgi:AcrR family transcriptional regulator